MNLRESFSISHLQLNPIIAFTAISITYIMFRKLYPATYTGARTGQVEKNFARAKNNILHTINNHIVMKKIITTRRRISMIAAKMIAVILLSSPGLSFAQPVSAPFKKIKQIKAGVLNVGYADVGPANGKPVILLHGWPYDINSYAQVAPILATQGYRVIVPYLRGYGSTQFLSAKSMRNGQQAALAVDLIALMDALHIQKAILGGFDWGARTADIVAALWPDRVTALVSVSGYLIGSQEANKAPLPPKAELAWWYQYYFATERGRRGYEANRREFDKLIWQTASPEWRFSDADYDRSAAAFNNPDHVAIVIHNYRWRLGLAAGEPKYDTLEKKLATLPAITVPAVTLEGDANGAPHPDPASYANKFKGKYAHHTLTGGIGHNLPQEAPQAFANAIIEADALAK